MPHFTKPTTTRLELPSTPADDKGWVDIRTKLLVGDLVKLAEADSETNSGLLLLTLVIVDWNYTDPETNEKMPITVENINHLEQEDFEYLTNWFKDNTASQQEGLASDEKKTSSDTLTPPSTAENPTSNLLPTI